MNSVKRLESMYNERKLYHCVYEDLRYEILSMKAIAAKYDVPLIYVTEVWDQLCYDENLIFSREAV